MQPPVQVLFKTCPTMPDPCWEWTGRRHERGYGIIKIKSTEVYVHHLIFRLFVGPVASMQVVMHRCDNPPCCNPSHLRLGTAADNVADCREKFRHAHGESGFAAKLTDATVENIRLLYAEGNISQHELARRFGVCRSTIRSALYGITWMHVQGALCPQKR
jgi:hypothetical protein